MHTAAVRHGRNGAHHSIHFRPQLTALGLALTAALAAMAPIAAQATPPWTMNGVSVAPGVQVSNTGSGIFASGPALSTLNNSGTIIGTNGTVIGTVGTLTNIANGVFNDTGSAITEILNNAGATIQGNDAGVASTGIQNFGLITTLDNAGLIQGGDAGIFNNSNSSIVNLTILSSGVVNGAFGQGIFNEGTITSATNAGTIGGRTGILNQGNGSTIGTLSNSGVIGGGLEGIVNSIAGSITGLSNESGGIISGSLDAIHNDASGTLGAIVNAGIIAGAVTNLSSRDLTVNGGTGSTFGTLTGFSGGVGIGDIGQIGNTASNVLFGSGNQLLNDNIDVGSGHAVTNAAATLQVNNPIAISGDYVQNSGATLNIGVNNGATANGSIADIGYGRLLVSGNATIDAGSTVALKKVDSYGFAQGQRFLVVQAGGASTDYHADSLNYAAVDGFNGSVSGQSITDGGNTDLLLTLVAPPAPPTGPGTPDTPDTPDRPINRATDVNSAAVLAGLFNYNGTDPALMNLFNAAAALGSADAGNRAGAQLSPTANAVAANQAAQAPTQQVLNVTTARLDDLRLSQAGGDSGSGIATGERSADPAVWAQAFGGSASQDQRDGVSGYHTGYSGLLIGSDVMIGEGWRVGALFNYADTSVRDDDANAGSSAHIDSYGLMAYAGYDGKPWYLNLSGGAVRQKYDTTRAIAFDGFAGNADGSYNGMQYIAAAQAGYPIDLGGTMGGAALTPIAGLTYSTLRQNGYTESGGNGAALTVDAADSHSLKSDLGVKLARAFKTSYGNLEPSVQLTWRHEYQDTRLQSVANFAADTSGATSFISQGPTPVGDTGVLSIGVTLMHKENLSIAASYVIESGGGYTAQTGDLLLRWRF
jgi:outer membrane autotransporter protein